MTDVVERYFDSQAADKVYLVWLKNSFKLLAQDDPFICYATIVQYNIYFKLKGQS
jgi:hypothetical protein